jgi:hypothetical protein
MLAEVSIARSAVNKISGINKSLEILEASLFNPDNMNALTEEDKVERFHLLNKAKDTELKHIRESRKMDVADLASRINSLSIPTITPVDTINNSVSEGSADMVNSALELLNRINNES